MIGRGTLFRLRFLRKIMLTFRLIVRFIPMMVKGTIPKNKKNFLKNP